MPASLVLRPFARPDFDRLLAYGTTEELLQLWAGGFFTYPLDVAQLERYLLMDIGDPPTSRAFTALDRAGVPVGHIRLTRIDRLNRVAAVAHVLVFDEFRGRGFGREMLTQVLRIGFDELGLHRIELLVFDFNQPAVAAYQHAGMVIEGRLRDVRQMGDTHWSVYEMSMLEDEWHNRQGTRQHLPLDNPLT